VKEHGNRQPADIFVPFQSQKYVEMTEEKLQKLEEEYTSFVHILQNSLTWKKL
jgi:hypothetical protein